MDALRKLVNTFPKLPGVYLMKDGEDGVLYVGKARDLQARVRQYLGAGDGRAQIGYLMDRVQSIDKIVCQNEEQAFILERDLIGKYKPRYNIRLKDDKAYLSVRVDENAEWPRLELVRRDGNDRAKYFGPYTWSYELRSVLEVIRNVVPLRSCSDTVFYNRQRPCLEYQIRRCAGPCCLEVDRDEYQLWVQQAEEILDGKIQPTIKYLTKRMERASEELRFEEAAAQRDRIEILEKFASGHKGAINLGDNRDVIGFFREGQKAALSIMLVRHGRLVEGSSYSFSEVVVSDEEAIEEALEQYYDGRNPVPSEIVIPIPLPNESFLIELLKSRGGRKVEFIVPERGVKARLMGLAELNAKQHFVSKFDAESRYNEAAARLATMLQLRQVPRRIECVDISNLQGSDIVGAVVVFFDGEPERRSYRRYKITEQGKPDDFRAMYEVVSRRLRRAVQTGEFPDLLLIDGGQGQLASALRARDELGIEVDIASLAKIRDGSDGEKKPERFFREGISEPILLDPKDEVTFLVQRIRDEVHRFVIAFHRETRGKRVFRSLLDDIPGIGTERRRRLFKVFGSIEKMREAEPEKLATAGRMPLPLAEKLLRILKDRA